MSRELNQEDNQLFITKKRKRGVTKTKKSKREKINKETKEEVLQTEMVANKEQNQIIKVETKVEQISGMIVDVNKEVLSITPNEKKSTENDKNDSILSENIIEDAIEKLKSQDANMIL